MSVGNIGLNNVNSRIKLYFGMSYGLTIVSDYGNGTVVKIRVPLETESGDLKNAGRDV